MAAAAPGGDAALPGLVGAWFHAGFESGQHAARSAGAGGATQAAARAAAAQLGDGALAALAEAWFRAGLLSGQHAAALPSPGL